MPFGIHFKADHSKKMEMKKEEEKEVVAPSEAVDAENSSPERHGISGFLHDGLAKGKDELVKAKLKFEHSVGLGHQPNVIPSAQPDMIGEERTVRIGWHPVMGLAGKWFAEKSGLGKIITEHIHSYPDPTQHWAVIVEDYVHELWMDEELTIIYINEKITKEEWHTFEIGKTRFNDEALRRAGEMVIYQMREKQAAYNLISNNCQNFAMNMLDVIHVGKHKEFATSYAVYKAATSGGLSAAEKLFVTAPTVAGVDEKPPEPHPTFLENARLLMDKYTTKLDNHRSLIGFD